MPIVTPEQIIAECDKQFEAFKDNCSGFVKAVAAKFKIVLTGQADHIVDQMQEAGWTHLKNGKEAKEKADAGWLVIAGLKSKDHDPARNNGHVAIVVKGPLDATHKKYPMGYWGSSGGAAQANKPLNLAWNPKDRDNVKYATMQLSAELMDGLETSFLPASLTEDAKLTIDGEQNVRQMSFTIPYVPHLKKVITLEGLTPTTPRLLAEDFLRETAPVFGFADTETMNFTAFTEKSASEAGVELRFKEEKNAVGNAVAVAYDQTIFGLPIWNAGVTVRIDAKKMNVTGAHNTRHYDIEVHRPVEEAPYLPNKMHPETVAGLLGLNDNKSLVINATSLLVYNYVREDRLEPESEDHDHGEHITLPLPPVADSITDNMHYVVTEVLFTHPYGELGNVNWRAFIEPDTGSVLYLRALVSYARAHVFQTDPVSASGLPHSASSPVSDLDLLRSTVSLFGLKTPPPAGTQELHGEYVKLIDTETPATQMPKQNPPYDFFYSCNTADFAACNAYYHCDGFFRLLKGMGINVNTYFNNTNFPVPVDPHAKGGAVNAAAPGNTSGNGLGSLVFGVAKSGTSFGIAADARVVIHEFGHAILWDHVNSPNFGFAHSPGDALAAILHDPGSKATGAARFETFPFMKHSGVDRRHDRKVEDGWAWFGSRWNVQYGGEEVLSTTLFRVYQSTGGDSKDMAEKEFASRYVSYLILKAVGLMNFTTPDPDVFVAALTEADTTTDLFEGHPGGALSKLFRWSFEKQGLYNPGPRPITKPGLPPDIDIYIEDGRKGEYNYVEDHTTKTEIWNRTAPDGLTGNQAPVPGAVNNAYVRINNRGQKAAKGVTVAGFRSRKLKPLTWPLDWEPLKTPVITVASAINPGANIIIGPFQWIPQHANDHIIFSASTAGDRSNIEIVTDGPIPTRRLVMLDNNIGQRAF